MNKTTLTQTLTALRSYMANVTGRKHWSPIHDNLHYALIEGKDGAKRWHMVHPDAMHHIQPLIDSGKATLHDTLGGDLKTTEGLRPVGAMGANRVASVLAEHPDYGTVILKGGEQHAAIDWGRGTSPTKKIQQAEAAGPGVKTIKDTFGPNAEYVSGAARVAGAPVVPTATAQIGGIMDEANKQAGQTYWGSPSQYVSIQPYIHDVRDARNNFPIALEKDPSKERDETMWRIRTENRLDAVEDITGAPDRHPENYVSVPTILPSGNIGVLSHGIDYEYHAAGGLLSGQMGNADEKAKLVGNAKFGAHAHSPIVLGIADVLASMGHFPALPAKATGKKNEERIWSAADRVLHPENAHIDDQLTNAGWALKANYAHNEIRNPALALASSKENQ